jgi:hypothetical protein
MNLTPDHIESKKRIGTLGNSPVFELTTTGGLHLVVAARGGKEAEVLGTGPHRAVARFIAKKRNKDLEISELSKADHIEPIYFEHLLPKYEEITDLLSRRE